MSVRARLGSRLFDAALALLLGGAYVALLLATVKNLGYARDEGFYFQAAKSYGAWFDELLRDPAHAMERATVDRYWATNSEHPAFAKSLFALSEKYLYERWQLFAEQGTAFRFPGMLLAGVAVSVTYLWGKRVSGRLAGAVAALGFAMMPNVFYHSHLDCFDVPVAAMWLVTTWAYFRSLDGGGLRWAIATGVLYGLLLCTKHNAWLLPPALVLHVVLSRGFGFARDLERGRARVPVALLAMATLGPPVFYATWPWLWHDTAKRLAAYAAFHMGHEYYNMEFLGRTYWKPPFPHLYAPVMTAATVPFVTLLLFCIGLAASFVRSRVGSQRIPDRSTMLLWLLSIVVSYAPWLSSGTPIFGGTKHWITAYPFLCLFAGAGFALTAEKLSALLPERLRRLGVAESGLLFSVAAAPIAITLHSHPWGLSAYTPLVGGAPGAATLGLNRTFWGYTTGAVTGFLNRAAPRGASVYYHDTAAPSWDMLLTDGRLRRDLRGAYAIAGSTLALYHHEPHMARVEYQIWVDYGTVAPAYVGAYDGVPVIWIYARPEAKR